METISESLRIQICKQIRKSGVSLSSFIYIHTFMCKKSLLLHFLRFIWQLFLQNFICFPLNFYSKLYKLSVKYSVFRHTNITNFELMIRQRNKIECTADGRVSGCITLGKRKLFEVFCMGCWNNVCLLIEQIVVGFWREYWNLLPSLSRIYVTKRNLNISEIWNDFSVFFIFYIAQSIVCLYALQL